MVEPVQLDRLARREVAEVVAEHRVVRRPRAELLGDEPDRSSLGGVEHAAGDLHAQHERVAALALRVEAHPLQSLHLTGDLEERLGDRPPRVAPERPAAATSKGCRASLSRSWSLRVPRGRVGVRNAVAGLAPSPSAVGEVERRGARGPRAVISGPTAGAAS